MKARRVIAIISWAIAACGLIALLSKQVDVMNSLPQVITFSIIGLLLFFIKGKSKEEKAKIKNDRLSNTSARHFTGLPLAEGTNCTIRHNPDGFVFTAGGNTFNLSNDKITDMCIKTDAEIQRQYVSSVGGAVGGAVLFGPIGAMIGGRAKEKKTTNLTHYLIITYLKDGQIAYICFEVYEIGKIQKWINDFRQCPHAQGVSVNL
ncbi:MAG: hypothetical protein LKJ45_02415 [Oscillospiraceae bacterium]|nr:hypothetical protein [Oscillospiraceae bacterium]